MKKSKAPPLVIVAVFTTITLLLWIFVGIYEILTSKPDSVVSPELLENIDPKLDTEVLNSLSGKLYFEDGQEIEIVKPSIAPSPTAIPSVSASPTGEEEPSF